MDNLYFFAIMAVLIFAIYYIHTTYTSSDVKSEANTKVGSEENFSSDGSNILSLNPYARCEMLGVKKFMVRDLRTKLWLVDGQEEGFNKFLPSRFGVPLMMSEKPDEYLPLRLVADPNEYLLSNYTGNGSGIRTISNPMNEFYVIQVFIYNGFNVLGYIAESGIQHYLYIDNNGYITNTTNPEQASRVEIVEI